MLYWLIIGKGGAKSHTIDLTRRNFKQKLKAKVQQRDNLESIIFVNEKEGEKRKYVDIQGASVTGATLQGENIGGRDSIILLKAGTNQYYPFRHRFPEQK